MPSTTTYEGCVPCCISSIETDCCDVPTPSTLYATFTDVACDACLDGQTVAIVYDLGSDSWIGSVEGPCAGGPLPYGLWVILSCQPGGWLLTTNASWCGPSSLSDDGWLDLVETSCSPFLLSHTGPADTMCDCGNGDITLVVTETAP